MPMRIASSSVRRMASSSCAGSVEGAGPVELGVPADRGHRGAELVRRVGDELAQPGLRRGALVEGLLDATEHPVERHAEVAGLGARRPLGRRAGSGHRPRWRRPSRSSGAPAARRGGSPTRSRARARRAPRGRRASTTTTSWRTDSSHVVERERDHHACAPPRPAAGPACGSRRRGRCCSTVIVSPRSQGARRRRRRARGAARRRRGGSGRAASRARRRRRDQPDVERAQRRRRARAGRRAGSSGPPGPKPSPKRSLALRSCASTWSTRLARWCGRWRRPRPPSTSAISTGAEQQARPERHRSPTAAPAACSPRRGSSG